MIESETPEPIESQPIPSQPEEEFPSSAYAQYTWPEEPGATLEPPEPTGPSAGQQMFKAVKEVLETIVPAIVIALLINLFLAQATRVYGQSMEPNLHTDQRLVVEKVSYRFHAPERNDVVVLKVREDAEELLIKRVIALPGETVEIKNGQVFINGQALDEPYLASPTRGHYGPIDIAPLHVFVLGDNRSASNDSRSFGPIPLENVVGRAWLSYWPMEEVGLVD